MQLVLLAEQVQLERGVLKEEQALQASEAQQDRVVQQVCLDQLAAQVQLEHEAAQVLQV